MKEEALDSDLAVHGVKIAICDQQGLNGRTRIVRYNPNHFRLGEERPKTVQGDREKCENSNCNYREVFKLKPGRISGSGVATKQLKEIRDSIEIEDLKRLLGSLEKKVESWEDVADLNLVRCIDVGDRLNMDCKCKTLPNHIKTTDLDRKVLRETLYSEIFQRHRRSIFALGSFLRMLKSKKSNYNVIKQEGESE